MEKQRLIKYYCAVFLVIVLFAGANSAAVGQGTTPLSSPTESTSPVSNQSSANQNTNFDNNMLPLLLSIVALAVSGGAIALSILKNKDIKSTKNLIQKYENKLAELRNEYSKLSTSQIVSENNQQQEVNTNNSTSFINNRSLTTNKDISIQMLETSIDNLTARIVMLENNLKDTKNKAQSSDYLQKRSYSQSNNLDTDINPFNQSTDIFQPDITQPLENLAYIELVNTYNNNPKLLEQKAIKVSEPTDSINRRHTDSSQKIILEKANNSNYWVIHDDVGIDYWLLPKSKLKIDQYRYETTKALFECNGYQAEYSSFKLVKPAKVIPLSVDEQTWQLEEPGILEFSVEA